MTNNFSQFHKLLLYTFVHWNIFSMQAKQATGVTMKSQGDPTIPQRGGYEYSRTETCGKFPDVTWDNRLSMLNNSPLDNETSKLLQGCVGTTVDPPVDLNTLTQRSESFPLKFPVDAVRVSEIQKRISRTTLESHANSVYPLIHEDMLPLIADWLKHKREQGTAVEKALYEKMGLVDLVQRLVERRAFCFLGREDEYKILEVDMGFGGWDKIGTDREQPPLTLKNYISYDEVKLSAMLTMSSHTEFINDGSRRNRGILATDFGGLEPRGIIIGVVGSRFEKSGVMEYQDIAVTPEQNTLKNGYGEARKTVTSIFGAKTRAQGLRQVWARFYGEPYFPLHEEVADRLRKTPEDPKYVLGRDFIFDVETYLKRTLITAEIILLEANTRALEKQKTAYLHVVGFGLGVWRALPEQEIYFLKAFEIALKRMMPKLENVSDLMFAYIRSNNACVGLKNGDLLGHIKIHFGKREPHTVVGDNKLLVVTYAWDGNALPGNEFWLGSLSGSGDPAAACSTQVAELHNVRINPRASASSLHIASPEFGVLHIADYAKRKL